MKVQKKGVFRVSCDTINISLKKFGPYLYIFVVVTFSKKTKNALVLRCLFYATHYRRHAREEDVE
jgi:hypothetical protein